MGRPSHSPSGHMASVEAPKEAPYSLVNPDLRGLFSHATLKRPPFVASGSYAVRTQAVVLDLLLKCYGAFVLLCLSSSWVLGAALPFLIAYLFSRDSPTSRHAATALLVVLVAPYTDLFKNLAEVHGVRAASPCSRGRLALAPRSHSFPLPLSQALESS